ncbi:OmpA family protein [Saccharibacter floricola]|uniref:OmpA-like domain-containing protein n=1 Tax=Saccharibacter floricola DSM 15669 TaxID=1123227 RepID=A0ABQ0P1C6_9PROT|nr:OmpA family protein [Saccharibacter floricola]GBQ08989.1 hypothetical protein AA15669_2004 [Saccharibacter floricola DSM 15669]
MLRLTAALRSILPIGLCATVAAGALGGCATHTPRNSYVVFFDRDSVQLNPTAQAVVADAALTVHERHASHITVSGSAGHNGDPDILKQLANARASEVTKVLERDGVDAKTITQAPYTLSDFEDSHVALRRVSITISSH